MANSAPSCTMPRKRAQSLMLTVIAALTMALILPVPATASQIGEWRGRTSRACDGACTLEWALSQLSDERREQVLAAMENDPATEMMIVDGDYFSQMSFSIDHTPHMSPRLLRATVELPRRAEGWSLDGFDFVKIDECQNWAVREHFEPLSDDAFPRAAPAPTSPLYQGVTPVPVISFGGGFPGGGSLFPPPGGGGTNNNPPPGGGGPDDNPPPDPIDFNPPPDIPPVPLPGSFWLLLGAIGFSAQRGLWRRYMS